MAVCLDKLKEEVGDALQIQWRSYLLRPQPEPKPLERFRKYTQSWMRPAGAEDAGEFRVWATDEEPPSHSIPPAVAVKASERQDGFDGFHRAMMRAYFYENRNVTARTTILEVAHACSLDMPRFQADLDDPALERAVLADHHDALRSGVTAVPTVIVNDGMVLPGAQPIDLYRRVVAKAEQLRTPA